MQISILERALGPVSKPVHRIWFAIAVITALCALALTILPAWTDKSVVLSFLYSLLRICLFIICVTTTFAATLIGYRLRKSWKKFKGLDFGLRSSSSSDTAPSVGSDTNQTPSDNSSFHTERDKPAISGADESVFIALAAELVESTGRRRELPNYRQLEIPLLELQQAAAATHTNQFEYANLRGLCEQACALMANGKLESLPDLDAARMAYKKRDPSLYIDLATELRQKIKT
jgi:hypothetical protein